MPKFDALERSQTNQPEHLNSPNKRILYWEKNSLVHFFSQSVSKTNKLGQRNFMCVFFWCNQNVVNYHRMSHVVNMKHDISTDVSRSVDSKTIIWDLLNDLRSKCSWLFLVAKVHSHSDEREQNTARHVSSWKMRFVSIIPRFKHYHQFLELVPRFCVCSLWLKINTVSLCIRVQKHHYWVTSLSILD